MRKYFNYPIKKALVVQNLITIEELDTSSSFSYPPETHDFYEFVYVDSGVIECRLDRETVTIEQGEWFLIPPQNRHYYSAIDGFSASIFIVCFSCNSELLNIFKNKIKLNGRTKQLLSEMVKEAKSAFRFPFNKKLELLDAPLIGANQLVENKIDKLLILLVRNEINENNNNIKLVMNSAELKNNLVRDITSILKKHLYSRITLEEISRQMYYSKTYLNNIFKKNVGFSIMQYYNELKIKEAKKMLRENVSPAAISNKLEFESPSYFTKVFKKHTDMTPSEYKKTIL